MSCRCSRPLERVHAESGICSLCNSSTQPCYQLYMQGRRIHDRLFLHTLQSSFFLHWLRGHESVLQTSAIAVRFRWLFYLKSPRMRCFLFPSAVVQLSTLKMWADTRWDSRWASIDAMIRNYPAIISALNSISEEGSGNRSVNAGGLSTHVKKSIFILVSFILHQLFGIVKVLSDHLKSKKSGCFPWLSRLSFFDEDPSLDYVRGECLVQSIIQQISNLRSEQAFDQIYEKAKYFGDQNGIDLLQEYAMQRTVTVPSRFKDCVINSTLGQREKFSCRRDFMDRIYISLIDSILVELNDRFSSKTLSLMKSVSCVYPESANFLNVDAVNEFADHIGADKNALKNEFRVLKPMIESKNMGTVFELFAEIMPLRTAFSQTMKMIKNALTMPISQVTCERSFSKMKIIKNYLRNSMSDQRLSDLTLLATERDIVFDYESVVDTFARKHKNSRILLR